MSASEAVERFVHDGATVGMGGQSIGRCAMALTHEVVRQGVKDLTLVGCNLSMSMDLLVGAGLARRTECGTGNLERFGSTFRWRRAIEAGTLEVEDYSHLAMASRFLAGALGLPFMPSKSLLGTDILRKQIEEGSNSFRVIDNPWDPDEPVVLLPACKARRVDHPRPEGGRAGQYRDRGVHDPGAGDGQGVCRRHRKLRGADKLGRDQAQPGQDYGTVHLRRRRGRAALGLLPDFDLRLLQARRGASAYLPGLCQPGGEAYDEYLRRFVYECEDFGEHLYRAADEGRRRELEESMKRLM